MFISCLFSPWSFSFVPEGRCHYWHMAVKPKSQGNKVSWPLLTLLGGWSQICSSFQLPHGLHRPLFRTPLRLVKRSLLNRVWALWRWSVAMWMLVVPKNLIESIALPFEIKTWLLRAPIEKPWPFPKTWHVSVLLITDHFQAAVSWLFEMGSVWEWGTDRKIQTCQSSAVEWLFPRYSSQYV